ncbi:Tify [Cynara cardunculus var. scolymus]|uniref:Protein TIFY n=1 Tax=Cynara cardunculus var. scolymus TaxID=59895 RepID=A0A103XNJ3_CYNCS|nr:Tify [Cynara cardunculus var. scolymus]
MSTSSEIVDSNPLPNSNFSHTFNLFTQYLKKKKKEQENTHLPLGMASSTMNLFPVTIKSTHPDVAIANGFPQLVPNKVEPESTQMTIFFAGQVMVVDDDKAMEIFMMLGGSEKGKDWIPKTEPSDLVASTHITRMEKQGVRIPGNLFSKPPTATATSTSTSTSTSSLVFLLQGKLPLLDSWRREKRGSRQEHPTTTTTTVTRHHRQGNLPDHR